MHLYHVSEEPDITVFHPRLPKRRDLDPTVGLVWAIDEEHLPNFLTPRDCPRVTYHIRPETTEEDRRRFFTSDNVMHTVIIEHGWFDRMRNTTLYLYEFDSSTLFYRMRLPVITLRQPSSSQLHVTSSMICPVH